MRKENVRIVQMFYFANELANHKQSSIEILIDIPCSWHDNTTDPLWGRRKGIPACKHYSSNMAFNISCWLIIDPSHAMPVRLGGAMWRRSLSLYGDEWPINRRVVSSCQVLSYKFLYVLLRGNIVPIFSQPPTDNKLPLYYLVCIVGPLTYILIWLVISIFSPVCPCFGL
jgi:hypothetical protein